MSNGSQRAAPPLPATPAHVLIVDDDPGIRGFIQMTLQAEGYSVATAANGREALERIAAQRPHVILLDLAMPVMNGWQLHDRLRQLGLSIPVVFMTAGFSARAEAEARRVAGYLAKPF